MNPLLLFGGLAAAKRSVDEAVHRIARSVVAYAILVCSGLVSLAFLTAGGFLYITSIWGAVTASIAVAAGYAILGGICFLAIRSPRKTYPSSLASPPPIAKPPIETTVPASQDLPGGVIAVGILAAAGFLVGRSMTRKR